MNPKDKGILLEDQSFKIDNLKSLEELRNVSHLIENQSLFIEKAQARLFIDDFFVWLENFDGVFHWMIK